MKKITFPCEVKLTFGELQMASAIGCSRNLCAITKGFKNQSGLGDGFDWQVNVEGACGELALAKILNVYWSGSVNTFKSGGDVGEFQVRTRSKPHYDLIIRDSDKDDSSIFWLVTGCSPVYTIHGWIICGDAKKSEWKQDYGGRIPAYFVPQKALNKNSPITETQPVI